MKYHSETIKVECEENCGNSPKKQLLKELTIALAKNDIDYFIQWLTDGVVWDIVGDQRISGKDNVKQALHHRKAHPVKLLRIVNIITHGNTGSVNGTMVLEDKHTIAFCDVYNFSGFGRNSKIKTVTSYHIQIWD